MSWNEIIHEIVEFLKEKRKLEAKIYDSQDSREITVEQRERLLLKLNK